MLKTKTMDSQNEKNSTISSQETLLLHHKVQTKNKNLENVLFITFLILIILTATYTTLISMSKTKKPRPFDLYLSSFNQDYCHLTYYPELCYDSMSSTTDTTILRTIPTSIFTTAIQVAINQINNITFSKTKGSLRLPTCRTWVQDSLTTLNESLHTIIDSGIESLTYDEMDNVKTGILRAVRNATKCLLALEKIDAMGVEEVKKGVKKARDYMVNSVGLLRAREAILNDFYNPLIEDDYYYYYHISYYQFDNGFLVFLYCGLYLFIGLLYFLFWRSN
ncbi:hypothetical protein CDL12_12955 [Handroanthus impetiginosus]|uniref:Pectinesterase inhibitor domain-containing protein n=1 Tax=Handroanthus impetiginosus TaxID=429701 RepID=A0A2G9HAT8_9LAMI|nr:hypothetical protein CDL12_12955 [Handroanthus impetiginosus]